MLYIMKTVGKFSLIFNALEQFMEHWNHLVKLAWIPLWNHPGPGAFFVG